MKLHGVVMLLAMAATVAAQLDPPPPPDMPPPPTPPLSASGSGSTGSRVQMNFGSDSSAGDGSDSVSDASGGGTGSAWSSTPTTSTDAWNLDWTWNASSSSGSSGSTSGSSSAMGSGDAGWPDYDDDVPIEVSFPGLDGDIERLTRRKYVFDKTRGFDLIAQSEITPGQCPYTTCIHLVFESDYGAMTPFDAFVLDRYESASGPVSLQTGTWGGGGPVPLVLGRLSNATRERIQGNWSDTVFNWNETRRTTWTLHPTTGNLDEIDVTLSLKQLYTLLPGYNGSDPASNGPFYSANLTDQVIIRVNAQVASPFAGASAMLPIVVNHTGSQLVEIGLTSSLLYEGVGVNGGNEIQLTFTLSRRKFGGMTPWFPARPSDACDVCSDAKRIPNAFQDCLDDQLDRQHFVFQDLLSFENNVAAFDLAPFAEFCFAAIASGDYGNGTNATMDQRVWNGTSWTTVNETEVLDADDRLALLQQTDEALRCWSESQCALGGGSLKADAQVVVLRHAPARTILEFQQPQFSFYVELGLSGTGDATTATTPVLSSTLSEEEIAAALTSACPNATFLGLEIEVVKYNNSDAIDAITNENARMMELYNRAMQWNSASASSDGSSDSDGGSAGDPGSDSNSTSGTGSTGGGSGPSGAGPFTPAELNSSVRPQPPKLLAVPAFLSTIEILSHNVTISLDVLAVFSDDDAQVQSRSVDDTLQFEVAPLDVDKFQYVPPPPHIDLSWQDEPAWLIEVKRRLPQFATNDSCGKCMGPYEACLLDPDCAFGVNTFLASALDRDRFLHQLDLVEPKLATDPVLYQVNVTQTLRDARLFFPSRGYEKVKQLVSCWAIVACDLDDQRPVYYKAMDKTYPSTPTTFQINGLRFDVIANVGEILTFVKNGRQYNYTFVPDEFHLRTFLNNVVFQNETVGEGDVIVDVKPLDSAAGVWAFSVTWLLGLVGNFYMNVHHASSSVTLTPPTIVIQAARTSLVEETKDWTALQWPRLEQWLDLFKFVPSTSFPSYTNGSTIGGGGGSSASNGTKPPLLDPVRPPTPPSAVCSKCSWFLEDCATNAECAMAVRPWLLAALPSTSALDVDGMYRAVWDVEATNDITPETSTAGQYRFMYRLRAMEFASCLAVWGCPVGVTTVTTPTLTGVVPTLVQFEATKRVTVPVGTLFKLVYAGVTFLVPEPIVTALGFVEPIENQFGVTVRVIKRVTNGLATVDFTSSFSTISFLDIWDGVTGSPLGVDRTFKVQFESHAPATPNWDFFLGWYGLNSTTNGTAPNETQTNTTGAGPCPQCLPKLQACYGDPKCWRSVQEVIVPLLRPDTTPPLPAMATVDPVTGQSLYSVDLGAVLYARIVNIPPALATAFQTPASWDLFTDILTCFDDFKCDIETMDSALEPPATVHIPTFLATTEAEVQLLLYLDSHVRIDWNGASYDYMEMATGSTQPLVDFVKGIFNGSPWLAVTGTHVDDVAHSYAYNFTFDESYFGRLPQFTLMARGNVPLPSGAGEPFAVLIPWQIRFESINQFPQWDLLLNLLSPPPPLPSLPLQPPPLVPGFNDAMDQCPTAMASRSTCYAAFDCQSLLATAVTLLTNHLQTTMPMAHGEGIFELELSWLLVSQVFPAASRDVVAVVMDVLRESALCAEQSLPSFAAKPVFDDLELAFVRPAHGPVSLFVGGNAFELADDSNLPPDDRATNLAIFVINLVTAEAGTTNTRATHTYSEAASNHTFVFSRLYASPPPHLFAFDDVAHTPVNSIDTPWQLAFQSPTFALNDAFAPWLAWLATNPQATGPPPP